MATMTLGEERIGISDEERRRREAEARALDEVRAQIAAIPTPESVTAGLAGPVEQHEDPEASSATARTSEGSFEDATTEPGARTGVPRTPPTRAELAALAEMTGSDAMPDAPTRTPAPSTPQPLARPTRPDGAPVPTDEGGIDDSPDSLHAMQGRPEPSAPAPLAPDDAEPLGDQGLGAMRAPSGAVESPDDRWSRLARGGDFRTEALPGDEESDPSEPEPDADADDAPSAESLALAEMSGREPTSKPVEAARRTGEGALDEGLPSEADIGGARTRDGALGFFRSLQNGLLGAIGRPRREMPHEAADLQGRRDTGLRERMQAKGVQRREEQAAERQATEDATTAQRQAESDARADRSLDLREQGLDLQRQTVESTARQRDAQTQHVATLDEISRATREEREDPASPISQGAQNAVRASLAALPERLRARIEGTLGDVSSMSAAQLEGVVRRLQTIGVRGTGGGGTGSGTSLEQMRDTYRALLESRGADPRAADVLDRSHLQSALQQESHGSASTTEGEEILPGVRAGIDLDRGEAGRVRTLYAQARSQHASLSEVRDIAQRHGARGAISPEVAAEMSAPLRRLMSMVAQMQNTGTINAGEMEGILAALPDPSSISQMTFDTLESRLRGFESELANGVASALDARGVDEAGIERALRGLRGASMARERDASRTAPRSPAPDASAGDTITVRRTSDGATRRVPRSAWGTGRAGYEVVQ